MKRISLITGLLTALISATSMVQSDIVDVALTSKDHTTLVATVKTADLVNTLKGEAPFTLFAPTDTAFDALPVGTLEDLLSPDANGRRSNILTYHVVVGKFQVGDVITAIKEGGGSFVIKTVNGGTLIGKISDGKVILIDENGGTVTITSTDVQASNGAIHVIDGVALPN